MRAAGYDAAHRDDRRVEGLLKLRFADDLRLYLHREPVDFRCGINTLCAALVEESMRLDPLARAVYAFRNRKCDRIKLLLYERTGFWLLLRRLEQDHFVQGYIHALEARVADDAQHIDKLDQHIGKLGLRIEQLEEQVRLLEAERFAPKSEKRKDRVFDEAELLARSRRASR